VYFREIAKRTEAKFIDEFLAQDETVYVKDVLGQVWRNSQILDEKFNHLKRAFVFMALAALPCVACNFGGEGHAVSLGSDIKSEVAAILRAKWTERDGNVEMWKNLCQS